MSKVKQRGKGYSGPDSTRPSQPQESDLANEGGTAPGGTVAFMGAASQWSTSKAANRSNFPTETASPIEAAAHMAKLASGQAVDESPAEKGDVPVHPGIMPGKYRTAQDANYDAPDGETPTKFEPIGAHSEGVYKIGNDPTANDGRTTSGSSFVGGKHRGDNPEVLKQTRGDYRP